jgi:ATP-dependent protease ClpP protease subunit
MKRTTNTEFNKTNKKHKKDKKLNECSDSDDSEDETRCSKIYLKNNHLYFHDSVNENNVDSVKKLMRKYLLEYCDVKNKIIHNILTPKPLMLHIFSYGGDIYSGLSLYDFIIEYNKTIPVYTIAEGIVASAATLISIAGVKKYITPNSYMLIHQLSSYASGNFEQIKDEFNNCEKIMDKLKKIYSTKTKFNKTQLSDILKRDINLDADDCKKFGLVDEIKLIDIFND